MKRKITPINDFIKLLEIRFLMIRVETPTREGVLWTVGLTDSKENPQNTNYIGYETPELANKALEYIFENFEDIERGKDFGNPNARTFLYLNPNL